MLSTLRGDGNVLLPVDTAGRVLELVLLLEGHWAEHRLTYPLVLLSPMAVSQQESACAAAIGSRTRWYCRAPWR